MIFQRLFKRESRDAPDQNAYKSVRIGYHFVHSPKENVYQLGYDDCRIVLQGQWIKIDEDPVICVQGLHAADSILDAVEYFDIQPSAVLTKVLVCGKVKFQKSKFCGQYRQIVHALTVEQTRDLVARIHKDAEVIFGSSTMKPDWAAYFTRTLTSRAIEELKRTHRFTHKYERMFLEYT